MNSKNHDTAFIAWNKEGDLVFLASCHRDDPEFKSYMELVRNFESRWLGSIENVEKNDPFELGWKDTNRSYRPQHLTWCVCIYKENPVELIYNKTEDIWEQTDGAPNQLVYFGEFEEVDYWIEKPKEL